MFDVSRLYSRLECHGYIPIPEKTEHPHIFATVVSSVTKFSLLGIRTGAHLVFDLAAPFEEGQPSCFVDLTDENSPKLQMSTTAIGGTEYVGRLLYCINHY